ncbi:MAG: ribose 5-phosphate isomerase B [Clostridia bacterium]|jgi:ribose 5-phosphate isomerase B|nr:ribose 5-phosphate isomerase B [Clostridia bacterium]
MIYLGSDHGGFELKTKVKKHLDSLTVEYIDLGCDSNDSVDYPVYAKKVADKVIKDKTSLGVLICGTGIGMSIAANKVKGIRAALCSDCYTAKVTREHNNSNVLVMGGRVIGEELAKEIVEGFIKTDFSGDERHVRRLNMLEESDC